MMLWFIDFFFDIVDVWKGSFIINLSFLQSGTSTCTRIFLYECFFLHIKSNMDEHRCERDRVLKKTINIYSGSLEYKKTNSHTHSAVQLSHTASRRECKERLRSEETLYVHMCSIRGEKETCVCMCVSGPSSDWNVFVWAAMFWAAGRRRNIPLIQSGKPKALEGGEQPSHHETTVRPRKTNHQKMTKWEAGWMERDAEREREAKLQFFSCGT